MASLGAVRSGDYYSGSVAGIAEDPVEGFGKTCGLRFHLGSEWNLRALPLEPFFLYLLCKGFSEMGWRFGSN